MCQSICQVKFAQNTCGLLNYGQWVLRKMGAFRVDIPRYVFPLTEIVISLKGTGISNTGFNNINIVKGAMTACEILVLITYGPCREKTRLRGSRQSEFQTSLLSYRD